MNSMQKSQVKIAILLLQQALATKVGWDVKILAATHALNSEIFQPMPTAKTEVKK